MSSYSNNSYLFEFRPGLKHHSWESTLMWKEQLAETRFAIIFSCGIATIKYSELSLFRAFFFLCFTEEMSQRFGIAWGWLNFDIIFILGWIILYKSQIPLGSPPNNPLGFTDLLYVSDIDLFHCYLLFHLVFRCQVQMCCFMFK